MSASLEVLMTMAVSALKVQQAFTKAKIAELNVSIAKGTADKTAAFELNKLVETISLIEILLDSASSQSQSTTNTGNLLGGGGGGGGAGSGVTQQLSQSNSNTTTTTSAINSPLLVKGGASASNSTPITDTPCNRCGMEGIKDFTHHNANECPITCKTCGVKFVKSETKIHNSSCKRPTSSPADNSIKKDKSDTNTVVTNSSSSASNPASNPASTPVSTPAPKKLACRNCTIEFCGKDFSIHIENCNARKCNQCETVCLSNEDLNKHFISCPNASSSHSKASNASSSHSKATSSHPKATSSHPKASSSTSSNAHSTPSRTGKSHESQIVFERSRHQKDNGIDNGATSNSKDNSSKAKYRGKYLSGVDFDLNAYDGSNTKMKGSNSNITGLSSISISDFEVESAGPKAISGGGGGGGGGSSVSAGVKSKSTAQAGSPKFDLRVVNSKIVDYVRDKNGEITGAQAITTMYLTIPELDSPLKRKESGFSLEHIPELTFAKKHQILKLTPTSGTAASVTNSTSSENIDVSGGGGGGGGDSGAVAVAVVADSDAIVANAGDTGKKNKASPEKQAIFNEIIKKLMDTDNLIQINLIIGFLKKNVSSLTDLSGLDKQFEQIYIDCSNLLLMLKPNSINTIEKRIKEGREKHQNQKI